MRSKGQSQQPGPQPVQPQPTQLPATTPLTPHPAAASLQNAVPALNTRPPKMEASPIEGIAPKNQGAQAELNDVPTYAVDEPSTSGRGQLNVHRPDIKTPVPDLLSSGMPRLPSEGSKPVSKATTSADSTTGLSNAPRTILASVVAKRTDAKEFTTQRTHATELDTMLTQVLKDVRTSVQQAQLDDLKATYGVSQKDMDAFCGEYRAKLVESASAGRHMSVPNDHWGVLKVAAHAGRGMTIAEDFLVLKMPVQSGSTTEDRYFIKGYGGALVKLDDLKDSELLVQKTGDKPASEVSKGELETPLRSAVLEASRESPLYARRTEAESADVATLEPLNPSAMKDTAAWWSNAETALSPGAGPLNKNGIREFQIDLYTNESRLVIFRNEYEFKNDQAIPVDERRKAIGKPAVDGAGAVEIPADAMVGGRVLGQIQGVSSWEVMSPSTLAGVKFSKVQRNLGDLTERLRTAEPTKEPTVIHITCDDGSQHKLELSDHGIKLSMLKPEPSFGAADSAQILRADDDLQANVDVYSYDGDFKGVNSTTSGVPVSQFGVSTGEQVRAAPLITNSTFAAGALRAGLRLVTLQPLIGGGRDASTAAFFANLITQTGVRYGIVAGLSAGARRLTQTFGLSQSGVLGGSISQGQLIGMIATTIAVQEAVTRLGRAVNRVVPRHWLQPENGVLRDAGTYVTSAVGEMLRLTLSAEIQHGMGLARGSSADWVSLAAASAVKGFVELGKEKIGDPRNHPGLITSFNVFYNLVYSVARGVGNAYALDGEGGVSAKEFQGEVARRIAARADSLADPLAKYLFDKLGVLDMNGGTFFSQEARDVADRDVAQWVHAALDQLSVESSHLEEDLANVEFVKKLLGGIQEVEENIQQYLNRRGLSADQGDAERDLLEDKAVTDALEFAQQMPSDQQDTVDSVFTRLDNMIEANETGQDVEGEKPTEFVASMLRLSDHAKLERELDQAEAKYLGARAGDIEMGLLHRRAKNPDLKQRLPGTEAGRLTHTDIIPKSVTTWTRKGQEAALPRTKQMAAGPNVLSLRKKPLAPNALSKTLASELAPAVRGYTRESQYYHLPIRFPYSGQLRHTRLGPGITVPYVVLNQMGNTTGDPAGMIDPFNIPLVNLAAHHAPSFPSVGYRGVVTVASFVPGDTADIPGARNMRPGDVATLTEIFSMTASSRMAAYFGVGINAGAPIERSQLLVVAQSTATNFANIADLAQAEMVMEPGAAFTVERVDVQDAQAQQLLATATDEQRAAAQKLGQVVFLRQIDTLALERRFDDFSKNPGALPPDDQCQMIEPRSGNFLRAEIDPADVREGGTTQPPWIFDVRAQQPAFRRYDPAKDAGKPVLVYDNSPKSYFLGRPLHGDQPVKHARWKNPYTASDGPDSIKHAIHAAILRGDRAVSEGHLDTALSNVHHAKLMQRQPELTDAQQRRLDEDDDVRDKAALVAASVEGLQLGSPLNAGQATVMAELLTSVFRKRIQLIDMTTAGTAHVHEIDQTYDEIDLKKAAQSMPTPYFEPLAGAVVVAMTPEGFANQRLAGEAVEGVAIQGAENGPTVENMLHAFQREAFPEAGSYTPDANGIMRPDAAARRSAALLLRTVQRFAATPDFRIQEFLAGHGKALVDGANSTLPLEGKGDSKKADGKKADGKKATDGKSSGRIDPANISANIAAFARNRRKTTLWLKDRGVQVIGNDGGAANNCLIISLVQHATGDFDSEHPEHAAAIRAALVAQFPHISMVDPLHSDTNEARWLAAHVHTNYGQEPAPALWFLEPGSDGRPIPRQVSGTGADGSGGIITVANWGRHFEAVRDDGKLLPSLLPDLAT